MPQQHLTFGPETSGINEFSSRIAADQDMAGYNWHYIRDRQIAKRPGSLAITHVRENAEIPPDGFNGIFTYVPAAPYPPVAYTLLNPISQYSGLYDNRKYTEHSLLCTGEDSNIYRVFVSSDPTIYTVSGLPYAGSTAISNLNTFSFGEKVPPCWGWGYISRDNVPIRYGYTFSKYAADGVTLNDQPDHYSMATSSVDFNGIQYIAGKGGPLIAYDGARYSVAGTPQFNIPYNSVSDVNYYAVENGAGLLNGTYSYLLRPKLHRPNGTVTYGRERTITITVVNKKVLLRPYLLNSDTAIGDNAAAITTKVVPRRLNRFIIKSDAVASGSYRTIMRQYALPNDTFSSSENIVNGTTFGHLQPGEVVIIANYRTPAQKCQVESVSERQTILISEPGAGTFTAIAGSEAVFTLGECVEIYRTLAGGSTYYYVADIPFGASYDDSMSDATLQTKALYSPLAYDPGPAPEYTTSVCTHQNRLCVTAALGTIFPTNERQTDILVDTLMWSQPNTDEFPADNTVTLSVDTKKGLLATFSHDGILYAASENALWAVQGDLGSAESFSVEKLSTTLGIASNTAYKSINGRMLICSSEGVYELSGRSINRDIGYPVRDIIQEMPTESLQKACAQVYNNLWILAIPYSDDSRANSLWLIYDFARQCWYKWTNLPSSSLTIFNDHLWCVGRDSTSGIVRMVDILPSDALAAIDMQFQSQWHGNEAAGVTKHFNRVQLIAAGSESQNFDLQVRTESNWIENVFDQDTTVSFKEGQGYADLPYASVPYGDANKTEQIVQIARPKAKSMRLTLSNNDPLQKPIISGWSVEVSENADTIKDM